MPLVLVVPVPRARERVLPRLVDMVEGLQKKYESEDTVTREREGERVNRKFQTRNCRTSEQPNSGTRIFTTISFLSELLQSWDINALTAFVFCLHRRVGLIMFGRCIKAPTPFRMVVHLPLHQTMKMPP